MRGASGARPAALRTCATDRTSVVFAALLAVWAPTAALACDDATIARTVDRADRAERSHARGAAIVLRARLLACPRDERTVANRIALGEHLRARDEAAWLLGVTGPVDATTERALEVGRAFEAARMWTEAAHWYDHLARRAPWRVEVPALVGLGRAYEALGDLAGARRAWESALAR